MQRSKPRRSVPLDFDMDQNEPLLVDAAEKVLNQSDIAAFDLASMVEAEVVMKRITAVAEHRRAPQHFGHCVPGNSNPGGQARGGFGPAPDTGRAAETQPQQCPPTLA